MASDWSSLIPGLLLEISKRITCFETYVCFRAVCKSWRSAAPKEKFNSGGKTSLHNPAPWLMLAEDETGNNHNIREFFSLSTGKIHRLCLPEASTKRCLSSQGWLMTVDEEEVNSTLLHPLSRVQLQLPRLDTFPDHGTYRMHFIRKFVLSSSSDNDDDNDFVVMVIWGRRQLGFCRPGDSSWTTVIEWHMPFLDIIYHHGKLYGLDTTSGVLVCDVHGPNPTTLHQVFSLPENFPRFTNVHSYLVELSGKFLIIFRRWEAEYGGELEDDTFEVLSNITTKFYVFEANLKDGACAQVTNLGNKALFLGHNSNFFVDPSTDKICKPNCIYFTDDCSQSYLFKSGGAMDMGIYSLSDGTIESFFDRTSFSKVTPPTWVQPTFICNNSFFHSAAANYYSSPDFAY